MPILPFLQPLYKLRKTRMLPLASVIDVWIPLQLHWFCLELMEFFLNGAKLSLNSANSGKLIITEAWNRLNLKIWLSHVSSWHCGSMLVSDTRGGWLGRGSSPFTVIKYFCHWIQRIHWKWQDCCKRGASSILRRSRHYHLDEYNSSFFFFLNFCWHMSICGDTDTQNGFCLIRTLQRHTWYTFVEIHLWCDTFAGV